MMGEMTGGGCSYEQTCIMQCEYKYKYEYEYEYEYISPANQWEPR
jgi:hypothetical protein